MQLSEAEIQVLASLEKARIEGESTDRQSLQAGAERFWIFAEDWSPAYSSLVAKGLIEGDDTEYLLTTAGRALAREFHRQRPDMYWYYYQKFYQAARASEAHSELCRRVFGQDLCQEGQTDMAALKDLMAQLDLNDNQHLLDLGCGAGVIAEYVSDETGASVVGLDYSAPAIKEAQERTAGKRARLEFALGDMNALDLAPASLDAVISLDTLYWAADLEDTLSKLAGALRPGGLMGIFMNHHIGEGTDPAELAPEYSKLSKALTTVGLAFETSDYTQAIGEFWHRIADTAADLKQDFEAEGNGFIAASLIREAADDYLPDVRAGRIARYLYLVRC
jgi:cyclopropane fatty-acyl-phospholipid synthase-like methyltransferase